jgi:hypothetical protein
LPFNYVNMGQIKVISGIWSRSSSRPFTISNLAERLKFDAGHDAGELTESDFSALIEGKFAGDWNQVAFTFSELLTYYAASEISSIDGGLSAWSFTALTMGEACRRNATDWDREFNFLMMGFEQTRGALEVDEALFILRHIFAQQ